MADLLTIAIVFFILALVAAVLGMYGVAGISMDIAKWLVIVFIVLAILSLLFGRGIFLGAGFSLPLAPVALGS
ncbi:MAG TPA: DUF1328 domain-containing protein [Methanotrichaceae archaeon]|nr:DUF1328 domain-containing protein [Methanotrichaceae archaeon]